MPYMLVFKRYAPFATFGGGFEGDTRTGPTPTLSASARTIGVVDFTNNSVSSVMLGYSSGSRWRSEAKYAFSKVHSSVSVRTSGMGLISFTAYTAGSNPCIPLSPDIDTFVDVDIKFAKSCIVFSGKIRGDSFPNAEVWAYDRVLASAHSVMLFDYRTGGGRQTGPATLYGTGEGHTLGSFFVEVPIDNSGHFISKSIVSVKPVQGS